MSPSEKEFGELIGAVRAVERGLEEMRRENAEDHASVMRRIDAMDEKLGTKADNARVNDHAGRLKKLELGGAKFSVIEGIFRFLVAAAALALISGFVGLLINRIGGG